MAIDPQVTPDARVTPDSAEDPLRKRRAQGGDRAQPGDVIGIESDGETTELGDTAEDEDERRRDAEDAARDRD